MSVSHLSMCSRDWLWPIRMITVSSKAVKNLQSGLFFIDAAVGSGTSWNDWHGLSVV